MKLKEYLKRKVIKSGLNEVICITKTEISKRTGISKLKLFGEEKKTSDLIIFNKNGSQKIIKGDPVDKILDQIDLTNAEKLEFKFEKDFPGKRAKKDDKISQLFREWLVQRGLYDIYFKYGELKDG